MSGRKILKNAGAVALASVLAFGFAPAIPVFAETDPPPRQFSAKSGALVLEAQEYMTASQYDMALNTLARVQTFDDLSPYEKSIISQMQGTCFYELDQYAQSISAFEQAISAGGLTSKEAAALRMNIAQLLIASERFAEGAEMMEAWQRSGGTFGQKHEELLWQAWSQAGRYDRALPWAEKWFRAAKPKERMHFDTMNFLYNQLKMPGKQADIVKQMIDRWPDDKTLWDALASLHAHSGREQQAFEVRLQQYQVGLLTSETELQQLVQYHSYYGLPYWGAKLMHAEMQAGGISKTAANYTKLADLWRQAREYKRAIPELKKVVELSGNDAERAKLAEAFYHEGQCREAETEIGRISGRGNANKAGLYTQLGVCYYEQSQDIKRPECGDEQGEAAKKRSGLQTKALDSFNTANEYTGANSKIAKTARSWTSFIKGEQSARTEMCVSIADTERNRCYEEIRLAYDAVVFVGRFILEDQACDVYQSEYDLKFRPWDVKDPEQVANVEN